MSEDSVRGHNRFDFQVEVVDADPETGRVQLRLRPDPGRYEWREADGKRVLYDRFDDVYFPHALVMDSFKRVLERGTSSIYRRPSCASSRGTNWHS
jgi:hypothetical protein